LQQQQCDTAEGGTTVPILLHSTKGTQTPWATQPVVSKVSSIQEAFSIWIDIQLQQVLYLCPAYLKYSWHFLDHLKTQAALPANSTIFTANAIGVYCNINTEHTLSIIMQWFDFHSSEIHSSYPCEKVLKGLRIIMIS
jgi:hypothetical protein